MTTYKRQMSDADFEALIAPSAFALGTARETFAVLTDASVVVKKALGPYPGSNFTEWLIWSAAAAARSDLADLLGACVSISETGRYLMMERLTDIGPEDYADVPDVPVWFNDRKPSAFGKNDSRVKIRDYGLVHLEHLLANETTFPPAFAINARTKRQLSLE